MTNIAKRHTWTRRNKHSNLISTLLQCVVPLPCVLFPAQTELTDLLSSIWSGFDLLRIWRWKDIIFEFKPQRGSYYTDFSTRTSSLDAGCEFRTSRHCQTSTSCHHLSGSYQNHGWITAFRYFSLCIIMCHMWWNSVHVIMKSNKNVMYLCNRIQSNLVVYSDIKHRKARQQNFIFRLSEATTFTVYASVAMAHFSLCRHIWCGGSNWKKKSIYWSLNVFTTES